MLSIVVYQKVHKEQIQLQLIFSNGKLTEVKKNKIENFVILSSKKTQISARKE